MKTKIISVLLVMLTVAASAQYSLVDIVTRTTNTSSSSGAFITITGVVTNGAYSATNPAAILIGDPLPTAFGKVNTALTYLKTAVRTNGSAQGQIFVTDTNNSNGGYWTNITFSGGGTGQPPSATLSNLSAQVSTPLNLAGGTNTHLIKSITITGGSVSFSQNSDGSSNAAITVTGGTVVTNFILNAEGSGTNTTLYTARNIAVTNLQVAGTTFLNNSNIQIFSTGIGSNGAAIPVMTESNQPSGLASVSSPAYLNNGFAWWAFSASLHFQADGSVSNYYIQYKFDYPVTESSWAGTFEGNVNSGGGFIFITFQGSSDGFNWTSLTTSNRVYNPTDRITNSFTPATYQYWRWSLATTNGERSSSDHLQLFGTQSSSNNVIKSTYPLQINATNVGINVAPLPAYALNVGGSINSLGNIYINGAPVGTVYSSPPTTTAGLSQLFATVSAGGIYTNLAGNYYSASASSLYFTNVYGASIGSATLSGSGFSIPVYNVAYNLSSIVLTNLSLTGTYGNLGGAAGVTVQVFYPVNSPPFDPSKYLLAGAGGNQDAGLQTNYNLPYRTVLVKVPATTTTSTATFSSPFAPSVGTNYSITFGQSSGWTAFPTPEWSAPTTNGFTLTTVSDLTGGFISATAWINK